jgi:NTP pyrophosphatase (non-canonical NTP hydrolase)
VNEKLKKIINTYGVAHQLKYFQSEVYELTEALLESVITKSPWIGTDHIAEEIADVMVMLKQFQLYFDIGDKEIKDIMEFKIDRQIGRIEKECKHQNKG